jgi:hypothetical protein
MIIKLLNFAFQPQIRRKPNHILYLLQLQTKACEERVGEYFKARKTRPFTLLALCHHQVKDVCIFVRDTVSDMLFEYCTQICIENPLVNIWGMWTQNSWLIFLLFKDDLSATQAVGYTVVCRIMWTTWRVWNQAATLRYYPSIFLEVLRKTSKPSG